MSAIIRPPSKKVSLVERLEKSVGADWLHIKAARDRSELVREIITGKLELATIDSEDTSVVVNGSLARDEFTEDSDIDWTLLIDGLADPKHLDVTRKIEQIMETCGKKPGREGVFGNMTFSHDLIHRIGGEDDTNSNTTRRILLLLESRVVGRADAHKRVRVNVLNRYIEEDDGFRRGSGPFRIPRFLLNDLSRYWRTMAVDFASKQRRRFKEGWALRNLKLRMSRKLIFASGLLVCFSFHLGFDDVTDPVQFQELTIVPESVDWLERLLCYTPLEIVAGVLLRHEHLKSTARKLFDSYNEFLGILSDKDKREELDNLGPDDVAENQVAQEGWRISHDFRDGLFEVFFDQQSELFELTKTYGVF